MLTSHIDLGQLIIGTLIVAVGWFVKREITDVGVRLDRHENIISDLVSRVSGIAAYNQALRELMLGRRHPPSLDDKL